MITIRRDLLSFLNVISFIFYLLAT